LTNQQAFRLYYLQRPSSGMPFLAQGSIRVLRDDFKTKKETANIRKCKTPFNAGVCIESSSVGVIRGLRPYFCIPFSQNETYSNEFPKNAFMVHFAL
jgi:hypothetical protein